ncbi:MAG: hypothetical protein J2P17_11550, partial [Mycobacterium sp.]|nr:hypothetical protein [Mycobacterium sp.]
RGPDISADAAASLAGISADKTRILLRELTRCHLMSEHTPGRFVMHDLLRAYAAELSDAEHSSHEARGGPGVFLGRPAAPTATR